MNSEEPIVNTQTGGLGPYPSDWRQTLASHEVWDLVVVGGGITGAGVLREAARRGLKVLLVEQQDFAWGTSSRSSKMVHGGLRYLGQGDVKLTRHSLHERERLLRELPGLVERMGYLFTLRKDKSPPPWGVRILLWLYDRIAGIKDHRRVDLSQLAAKCPGIHLEQLKDCFYYTDAVTDDARLVMRVLHEAVADGGVAINYVRASELLTNAEGQVEGVRLRDTGDVDHAVDVKAKLVVNATGAWADRLRRQVNDETRVRPLRGSHLVIPAQRLPLDQAVTLMHPGDQRAMFVFPWEGRTVIGTTDLDHAEDLDREAGISAEEVKYLLEAANDLFPKVGLTMADVISSWSGVRPVIGSDSHKDPSRERRDHAVWRDGNLITVSGGKLTTFRLIALDVLRKAELLSADDSEDDSVFAAVTCDTARLSQQYALAPALVQSLRARYGDVCEAFLRQAKADELTLIEDTQISLAECRWLLRREAVKHLDDLMLRRTRLGQLLERGGEAMLGALAPLFQQELGYSDERWHDEVERYRTLWQRHYFLPAELCRS